MSDNTSPSLADVFTGGLANYFDALTQIKLQESYNVNPPQGYAFDPNGQLVTQANQQPSTSSGAPATTGGAPWVLIIGGALVAVAVLAIVLKS